MSELKWPSEEEVRKMFAKKEGFGSDATLSAAMGLPEVLALVKAARPFYAAVFNDNGDVTISTGHITTGDWLALDAAIAALTPTADKEPKT